MFVATIMINLGLKIFLPKYYELVGIGIKQIPAFVIGIYAGYISLHGKSRDSWFFMVAVIAIYIICFLIDYKSMKSLFEKMICISFISFILYKIESFQPAKVLRSILSWLGKYSLELYLLHLFIYCFLGREELFGEINIYLRCSLMIVVSLVICAPIHKAVDIIVKQVIHNDK